MCGLAGYAGAGTPEQRIILVQELAKGIDRRGGHSCGYVSIGKTTHYSRRPGKFKDARKRFLGAAAEGEICMMHARYATCGTQKEKASELTAHPFAIKRGGDVVLWGAHNGVISNAFTHAREAKRVIDVDSQEIFECLADKNYKGIQEMYGYGVITWIEKADRSCVKMARLSSTSDMFVCKAKTGGIIWGSTMEIVRPALAKAGLELESYFEVAEVGRMYEFNSTGVFMHEETGIKLGARWEPYGGHGSGSGTIPLDEWRKRWVWDPKTKSYVLREQMISKEGLDKEDEDYLAQMGWSGHMMD